MYKFNRTTALVTLTLLMLGQTVTTLAAGTLAGDETKSNSIQSGVSAQSTAYDEPRNQVIVKMRGGDYSDPVAAANNAYQGDTWCVSPQLPEHPCVIRIRPGIYVLPETLVVPEGVAVVGRGKHEVLLLAGRGVHVAVASRGPLVADLSILNDEPLGVALVFGAELRRVKLTADAQALTNSSVFEVEDAFFDITDSDISANGSAIDVEWIGRAEPFFARRSRITGGGIGIHIERSGGVVLRDCDVTARGSSSGGSLGISIDETDLDVEIYGGSLSAEDTGAIGFAIALDLHDFTSGNLLMVGTRVHASGARVGEGVRLDRDDFGFDTFDGVSMTSSSAAIVSVNEGGTTTVVRSHLDAPIALNLFNEVFTEFPQPVEISHSFIKGEARLFENPTQINSSVLTGVLSGDDITCRNVYDANYILHRKDCPTN